MNRTRLMIVFCGCLAAGALWPPDAAAQRRGGHPAGGQASVAVSRSYSRPYYGSYYRPYYGSYYRPYYGSYYPGFAFGFGIGFGFGGFYSPYYGPYYSGWYPFYAQYPYPYPYPYPVAYYSGNWASARLEVKPRDAQVYIDGYFVGVVDQFDGVFQRLDLPTGEHEIVVYQKGHGTYRQRTLFRPGESYNFKAILEPLPAGAPDEPVPQPSAQDPYREPRDPRDPHARAPYGRDPGDDPNRQPPPPQPGDRERTMPDQRGPEGNFGTLNIRVQPGDATVVIDGERWDGPEGGSRLAVQLVAGSHRVEVRKNGFKPYSGTIQIRPGETQALNISLPPGD